MAGKPASTLAIARVQTVTFLGLEVAEVDVEVQLAAGLPAFTIVGLPDKAVAESRERVRAALVSMGLALPPKRIIVNLAPADVLKEGSHFDLPVALGLLVVMGVLSSEAIAGHLVLGELALDGALRAVPGVLAAAVAAAAREQALICPAACGSEAAWLRDQVEIVAAPNLLALIAHLRGQQRLSRPEPPAAQDEVPHPDLRDVKGQETAKRALEIAAAGGHNLLLVGPPGAGKSLLAARLPGFLPPLDPAEALEVSMIHSASGRLDGGRICKSRPFRAPHHGASMAAMVGGGANARPGEVSLAHKGVLFLDELPEFGRAVLEALRQPLETGKVSVARAAMHVTYPARFQLVAAMNPCRCGHLGDPALACTRAPRCGIDYQARLSGPLLDRIDLNVEVPALALDDLSLPPAREGSAEVAARVAAARARQSARLAELGAPQWRTNAEADGEILERAAPLEAGAAQLLRRAAEQLRLSARGWHRTLRVARTVADLDGADLIRRPHIAEAVALRRQGPQRR